ncbi:carbohydrate deacetylase [Desulfuromonas sp. TF]|uniref:carbohydrate deacetylase n=1 Tax=Desulfuromonas sp. TF TaxID=1232410 RepID=UPI00041E250F|nr:ChbG/HpnK family deacetylase [Desulfuromonas sp. TF]
MIRLIINADDLGCSPAIDRGILCAFEAGGITSASLLANGRSFGDAAREIRAQGIPVGVHLNLSEGRPLSGPIRGLTDRAGDFPGKTATRRALAGGDVDRAGLQRELSTQVLRTLEAGLTPDHLDTHQHAILFPPVSAAVLEVAQAYGIGALRLPEPADPPVADPPGLLGEELAFYRRSAPAVAKALRNAGLDAPDGLWGMPFLNRLDEAALCGILGALPPGTWELMVHPGYCDPARPFAGPERELELEALTASAVRGLLGEREIRLITFGDLACAS